MGCDILIQKVGLMCDQWTQTAEEKGTQTDLFDQDNAVAIMQLDRTSTMMSNGQRPSGMIRASTVPRILVKNTPYL